MTKESVNDKRICQRQKDLSMTKGSVILSEAKNLNIVIMYNTYYTYIMSSLNNTTIYVGMTNDLERRVSEHKSGLIPGFTQKYNCKKLVYFESFSDIEQAIARE